MAKQPLRFLLISDFNIDIFRGYLANDNDFPVEAIAAPFGQVIPTLEGENLECWQRRPDIAVVWTQPGSVIPSFKPVLNYQPIPVGQILDEVDVFSRSLLRLQDRVHYAFVPTWVLPSHHRGYGMLDMKNGVGITNILMQMNLRLSENLDKAPTICLLNTQKWIETAGQNAFNPTLWYMSKVAFGHEVFKAATQDIQSAIRAFSGASRKLILVDLDNTLWGGIVGDVGWEELNLGGHNALGEAFVDFQYALKSLTNRGVLLGIVSKNTESIALEAIKHHPEMVLRLEDFAGWKINWADKAQNIVDLVSELNLGLQTVVFIDDNAVERARVREALPEVFVPEWPGNAMMYTRALLRLPYFDTPSISQEDRERTTMYVTERQRKTLKRNVGSLEEWLKTLHIKVKVEDLNEINLQRAAQLLNKTNQMNLSTRRIAAIALAEWVKPENRRCWTFRVSDKFGDSGLSGLVSLEVHQKTGRIIDFVLSCRVMGRKIEETLLYTVLTYAHSIELDELHANYIPTAKNQPCLAFWNQSGFAYHKEENRFTWRSKDSYSLPEVIHLEWDRLNTLNESEITTAELGKHA